MVDKAPTILASRLIPCGISTSQVRNNMYFPFFLWAAIADYGHTESGLKSDVSIGDGQVYTTVEDLCRWDQMMSAAEGSPFYDMMHTQVALNSGEVIDYALGLSHGCYRGQKQTELMMNTMQHLSFYAYSAN